MASLRIGTWNVEYAAGAERNARRRQRLLDARADIWVLTETHDDLDLGPPFEAVSTEQRPTGRGGGRWTSIWSRFPVVERLVVDDPVRTVAAIVDAPGGPIVVYGTVLPWHSDPGPDESTPARAWAEQDRVLTLQIAEWRRLRERFPGLPLVVAGDLNMNLGGRHYYGTARGRLALREGLAELRLACVTEWEGIPAGSLRYPPIDHLIAPAEWAPRTTVVAAWEGTGADGVKLSDHSGVVAEVARGATGGALEQRKPRGRP